MQLTHQTLIEITDQISRIVDDESTRLGSVDLWWNRLADARPITGRSEKIAWLKATGGIEYSTAPRGGGTTAFDRIDQLWVEVEPLFAQSGLRLSRADYEDADGNGFSSTEEWARRMAAQARYWPQHTVAQVLRSNPVGYDGLTLFNTSHPKDGKSATSGTFTNNWTGGGANGALPLANTGDPDDDRANLRQIAIGCARIRGLTGSNGMTRALRASRILVPPALEAPVSAALDASTIRGTDLKRLATRLDLEIVVCPELGADFDGGSDTTWYLSVDQVGQPTIGSVIYAEREPFSIYPQIISAGLDRIDEIEWRVRGRNVALAGHPYLIFRALAS